MKPGDLVQVDVLPFTSQNEVMVDDSQTGQTCRAEVVERLGPDVVLARVLPTDVPEEATSAYSACFS